MFLLRVRVDPADIETLLEHPRQLLMQDDAARTAPKNGESTRAIPRQPIILRVTLVFMVVQYRYRAAETAEVGGPSVCGTRGIF